METADIKDNVREKYGQAALRATRGRGPRTISLGRRSAD